MLSVLGVFVVLRVGAQSAVTYAEHVAPIIYQHCTSCHRPGEIAPFSLTSYEEVRNWGALVQYATEIRHMPPWKPDPAYQTFLGENYLSDEQIQTIAQWVDGGMPLGDPSLEPALPGFPAGSQIGSPDLVLSFAETHTHPGDGLDEYRFFVLPTGLTEDKDLIALELRPGNRRIVHHTLVWADTTGTAAARDAETPEYGFQSEALTYFGDLNSFQNQLPGYAPGQRPPVLSNGIAQKLKAGSDLLLQMHYAPSDIVEYDSSSVNLFFAEEPAQRYVTTKIMLPFFGTLVNGPFVIPANTVQEFHGVWAVPQKISLLSTSPHMHLLGTHWLVYAIQPNGDTVNLIRINQWDFHWQGTYTFPHPIVLEAGAEIHAFAGYDNTANNPNNPNDPPIGVTWGEGTEDEMYFLPFSYVAYQDGDENLDLNGSVSTGTNNLPAGFYQPKTKLYPVAPNPAHDEVKAGFTLSEGARIFIGLYNMQGQLVQTLTNQYYQPGLYTLPINVSGLMPGIYALRMSAKGENQVQKLVVAH